MHRKVRWGSRGVLMVKGAEVVRAMPSQVRTPHEAQPIKSIEEQEHSSQKETPAPNG